jgi:hypothetical protein
LSENKIEIIKTEYLAANEAYNLSFSETLNLLKYYTSIVMITLGVIWLNDKKFDVPDILLNSTLCFLVFLAVVAMGIQRQIIFRRTRNINRMNFLRNSLFEFEFEEDWIEGYNDVTQYNFQSKKYITVSTIGPFLFYVSSIIMIILIFLCS